MVRTKLIYKLKEEISHYLGIPYFINTKKLAQDNVYVGKGNWREIKAISSDYNTLKKKHIGIDCSGLVVNLLNTIFKTNLDVRKTSANILTSPPLALPITDYEDIHSGDLVRQKNGRHTVFIIQKTGSDLSCVESSRQGRGVHYSRLNVTDKPQIYRLISLQSTLGT